MYILPSMIDLGCDNWASEDHRKVAKIVGLCNPKVTSRDKLTEVCEAINKVPQDRIRKVTLVDLATEFNCPYIELDQQLGSEETPESSIEEPK